MKKMVVVLASLLVVACASTTKPVSEPASENKASASTENVTTAPISSAPISNAPVSEAQSESSKLASEIKALQQQSVYFDYDKFDIKPEYQAVVKKQADFMKSHKNDVVTIEGNTDERGSNEYNLGLGDKRAKAAQKMLEMLGVSSSQIKVISLGSEKPRMTCHEEKCWKENRRDDFIHNPG